MKVLQDKVLVKRIVEDEKSKSGLLHLPGNAKKEHPVGEVLAVGEGYIMGDKQVPLSVSVGDKIIFDPSWVVIHNGEALDVITEKCILLVL